MSLTAPGYCFGAGISSTMEPSEIAPGTLAFACHQLHTDAVRIVDPKGAIVPQAAGGGRHTLRLGSE